MEFAVAGSEAEGLYDLLQGAMTWPDSSMSVCLPPLKRHRWVPTATVSSLTAQESKTTASEPLVPKLEGGMSEQGAPPYLFPSP